MFTPGLCLYSVIVSSPVALTQAAEERHPASETVGWRPEPGNRGTLGLLISCVSTLAICVYSALHLNIPNKNHSILSRTFTWILLGILVPEVVIYTAWAQLVSARHLTKLVEIRQCTYCFRGLPHPTSICEEPAVATEDHPEADCEVVEEGSQVVPWTILHSFYCVAGGFVVNTKMDHSQEFIPGSPLLHPTPQGMRILAMLRQLPDIPTELIKDKNKENGLGKALAALQLSWLAVQCIARACMRLPVSPLEVFTVGHCVCALFIYFLWWSKPFGIIEPTVLSEMHYKKLAAFFALGQGMKKISLPQSWREIIAEYKESKAAGYIQQTPSLTDLLFWQISPRLLEEITEWPVVDHPELALSTAGRTPPHFLGQHASGSKPVGNVNTSNAANPLQSPSERPRPAELIRVLNAVTGRASAHYFSSELELHPDDILVDFGFSLHPRLSRLSPSVRWKVDRLALNRMRMAAEFLNDHVSIAEMFGEPYIPYATAAGHTRGWPLPRFGTFHMQS